MSLRPLLPLVLLVAALGGAALFLLPSDEPRGEARGSADPTRERASSPEAVSDLIGATDVTTTRLASADNEAAREVVAETPESTPDSAPAAAHSTSIRGRVVDERGMPVSGAEVRVAGNRFELEFGAMISASLTELGTEAASRVLNTTTDAAGRFELRGVEPGSPMLKVVAAGFAPLVEEGLTLADGERLELADDLVALDSAIVSGIVLDHAGRPVADAEVRASATDVGFEGLVFGPSPIPDTTSDANGLFRLDTLPRGPLKLRVTHAEHVAAERDLDASEARALPEFELRLGQAVAIRGRVIEVPVTEAADLVVVAERVEPEGLFDAFEGPRAAEVDADGRFEVSGLKPETQWRLSARPKAESNGPFGFANYLDGGNRVTEVVTATAGDADVSLRWQGGASVTFRVVDDRTGEPIENLEVKQGFGWLSELTNGFGRRDSATPGGVVRIDDLSPENPTDRLMVSVDSPGYAQWKREDIEVVPGEVVDLGTIRLESVPQVLVTVLDRETGAPIEGARVSLSPELEGGTEAGGMSFRSVTMTTSVGDVGDMDEIEIGGSPFDKHTAKTDEAGVATLDSFEGRRVVVEVKKRGYAPSKVTGWLLPEGEVVTKTMKLERGASVEILALDANGDPLAGRRIEHRKSGEGDGGVATLGFGGGRDALVTGADGKLTIENLAAGTHGFKLASPGGGSSFMSMSVVTSVTGGGSNELDDSWTKLFIETGGEYELTLEDSPKGTLTGRITELGEPLSRARISLTKTKGDGATDGVESRISEVLGGLGDLGLGGGPASARADREGIFELEHLEPGTYSVRVTHKSRSMPWRTELTISAGDQSQDFDLPVSILAGRVTGPDGRPVANVPVSVERATDEQDGGSETISTSISIVSTGGPAGFSLGGGRAPIRTDENGEYELRGVAPDADLVVTAEAQGPGLRPGSSKTVRVAADERRGGVDVQIPEGGGLEVVVTRADGSAPQFAMLTLDPDGFEGESKTEFLQGGKGTVTGLAPGRYTARVQGGSIASLGAGDDDDPGQSVVVVAGEPRPVALTMP